ncbi:hypothetical protein CY34DRAFT_809558 [Suillus luteus UH-Slu-Lm8-n1]|uniref:Unplaced genomic scaffold CY34scaffold_272, whole genome shotgun sequence n=1 Tax=Suillus luteus UH-Slu-Lm8-n1 TaxID=930992 RepID=A0A0D0AV36_9AGAM|nr:hypothetical protein CY34DRAFT_809558 [Suillus luteus UH-Slu-Lm8-n1]
MMRVTRKYRPPYPWTTSAELCKGVLIVSSRKHLILSVRSTTSILLAQGCFAPRNVTYFSYN